MKLTKDLEQLQLKDNGKQFYCQLIPESSTTTKETCHGRPFSTWELS